MSDKTITNRILLGTLAEFSENFSLEHHEESKLFENFSNYIILSKIDPEAFSDASVFRTVDVDSGGTFGIDAFALIVNDTLITNPDDLALQRNSKRLEVRFIFIQTKRSASLDAGDILKFVAAVKDVFNQNLKLPESPDLDEVRALIAEVFTPKNSRFFGGTRPKCELYFVTTGGQIKDDLIASLLRTESTSLADAIDEIQSATITHVGGDALLDSYAEIENRYDVDIAFDKNVPCEKIDDVEQAFIGYLPVNEFLKLITGKDGELRRNVFYENVRDFQGEKNNVNAEMAETLSRPDMLDKFILLNNGVTIVARKFSNLRSTEYQISDYYIVNGCQTSNMIFRHREKFGDGSNLRVPIKIIHTTSNDLISAVIRSTNRQTPVPEEAFVSLEKFHKRLQDYYKAYSSEAPEALFYERRSKEFANLENKVERPRIINLHSQIRSFAAVVLGHPHLIATRNPVTILRDLKSQMFLEDQGKAAYYLSSLMLFIFFKLEGSGKIDGKYEISRYWICWIARMLVFRSFDIGTLNSKKTDSVCENKISSLGDQAYVEEIFGKACKIFDLAKISFEKSHGKKRNGELIKNREFREQVKRATKAEINH
ncbi:AIPR family protein [Burkholderia glumae]|uniref:AIPR family protein n=1 Tax=Burkholderia glumae TaxID=337 RepID=UPI001463A682|nr:AIPR family protein [Burkholderia glumae]QJP72078.1 AIPR family protein [Burkholderia glumae]